jgi:hypothetical protein
LGRLRDRHQRSETETEIDDAKEECEEQGRDKREFERRHASTIAKARSQRTYRGDKPIAFHVQHAAEANLGW